MKKLNSYYFTDKEIVVKKGKEESRYELNSSNLRNIISKLDKEINFNSMTIDKDLENESDNLIHRLIYGGAVSLIIVISVFLSFINALMIMFVLSSLLLVAWTAYFAKNVYKDYMKLYNLYRIEKVCEDRKFLTNEYNLINSDENTSEELVHVC